MFCVILALFPVVLSAATAASPVCKYANWYYSFDKEGTSKCNDPATSITRFYRNGRAKRDPDYLHLLEKAKCCAWPEPWSTSRQLVYYANWEKTLNRNHRWARCPNGYFLHGLYRSNGDTKKYTGLLHDIEEGRCVKPVDAPYQYSDCREHSVESCLDQRGWCGCPSGYFVTGLYRGPCDSLFCLEKLQCCKPATSREALDDPKKVKALIMDSTLDDLAHLGYWMGYRSRCRDYRATSLGEDFVKKWGCTWYIESKRRCAHTRSGRHLKLHFFKWRFRFRDVIKGEPAEEELRPETLDEGIITNDDDSEATKTIKRQIQTKHAVTHTTTSSWKMTNEASFELGFSAQNKAVSANLGLSYTFSYEKSSSTSDATHNEENKTFSVSSSKTLKPHTSVRWRVVLYKRRTTIPYTATVLPHFAVSFYGYLTNGKVSYRSNSNFHAYYRTSRSERRVYHRFGETDTPPFYTALREESSNGERPWLWHEMQHAYRDARSTIKRLGDENRYTFPLTGQFEVVEGQEVRILWETITPRKRRSVEAFPKNETQLIGAKVSSPAHKVLEVVAKAGPNDRPAPRPAPPRVSGLGLGHGARPLE